MWKLKISEGKPELKNSIKNIYAFFQKQFMLVSNTFKDTCKILFKRYKYTTYYKHTIVIHEIYSCQSIWDCSIITL